MRSYLARRLAAAFRRLLDHDPPRVRRYLICWRPSTATTGVRVEYQGTRWGDERHLQGLVRLSMGQQWELEAIEERR